MPPGELAGPVAPPVLEGREAEGPLDPLAERPAPEPLHASEEPEVLLAGEGVVERERLRSEPEQPPHPRVARGALAPQDDLAPIGVEEPHRHVDRGGLSRPVRAEEPHHLASPDGEGEAVDGDPFPEALVEVAQDEHRGFLGPRERGRNAPMCRTVNPGSRVRDPG